MGQALSRVQRSKFPYLLPSVGKCVLLKFGVTEVELTKITDSQYKDSNSFLKRQKKFFFNHILRNKMIQHKKIRCNFIKNRTQKCTLLFISHRSEPKVNNITAISSYPFFTLIIHLYNK